jgi:hypothetical protein
MELRCADRLTHDAFAAFCHVMDCCVQKMSSRAGDAVLSRQGRSTIFTGLASLRPIVTGISFLIWRNVALDWEGARCRTPRAAEIQHLIQRQLTILHRIPGPETRHGIRREAQHINRIRKMPAFLVAVKCRRATREADPHSRRVPPKLGGALCAAP